jgi:hypothetical protein
MELKRYTAQMVSVREEKPAQARGPRYVLQSPEAAFQGVSKRCCFNLILTILSYMVLQQLIQNILPILRENCQFIFGKHPVKKYYILIMFSKS